MFNNILKKCLPRIRIHRYPLNTNIQRKFTNTSLRFSPNIEDFNVIEPEEGNTIVTGYFDKGFIVSGINLFGSVILFPKAAFLWSVTHHSKITPNSLAIIEFMNPTPGTGKTQAELPLTLEQYFYERGIGVEVMSSLAAASTFNVLNSEDRNVAAAILSMEPLDPKGVMINPKKISHLKTSRDKKEDEDWREFFFFEETQIPKEEKEDEEELFKK